MLFFPGVKETHTRPFQKLRPACEVSKWNMPPGQKASFVSIDVISNLRVSRRHQTGLSQFLLASDCHIKLKHFWSVIFILILSKRHQFEAIFWGHQQPSCCVTSSWGIWFSSCSDPEGDRGQYSGPWLLLKNSKCKGFYINNDKYWISNKT